MRRKLALTAVATAALAACAFSHAASLSSDDLFSPVWRGKTVTVEGVVHNASPTPDGGMVLSVYRTVSAFSVLVADPGEMGPTDLDDALVSVTGVLGVRFGPDGVPVGVQVSVRNPGGLVILRPPPADPYALPLAEVRRLRANPDDARRHRIHVRGIVTFSRENIDASFTLHLDEGLNVSVIPADSGLALPKVGDVVEVCAFLAEVSVTARLEDALFRVVGHDEGAIPPPRSLSVSEVVSLPYSSDANAESLYAQTVVTEGVIREVNRREKFMQIFITGGGETLLVLVPYDQSIQTPDSFRPGARVRAQGVISFYHHSGQLLNDRPTPHQNLTLHTASVEDVSLLESAPYWTVGRVWTLLGVVVAALLVGGLFAIWLFRRFERARFDAAQRERLRLSHDLHDNLQQLLAATMFRLDAAQSFFDFDQKSAKEQLGWAKKAVEGTQAGLRSVLWDLQEESEGPDSLSGLLRYAVGRMPHWQGKVSVETSGAEPESARSLGGRFLMIVQEAVGNALVRGRAEHVRVRLFFRHGLVRLVVSDDGCGFSVEDAPGVKEGHLGLSSMAARAHEMGGTFSVKSEKDRGTSVSVEIPV